MIMVDEEIIDEVYEIRKPFAISDFNVKQLNSNSYDVRLGNEFIYDFTYEHALINPFDKYTYPDTSQIFINKCNGAIISPLEFVLATTKERIKLPDNITASLNGKSSLARLGLQIHQTGGWIDAGFEGQITLELFNASRHSIKLTPEMRIGQLVFHKTNPCMKPYNKHINSKYCGQSGVQTSKYYANQEE